MARPFNLEISESAEYLSKSLSKVRTSAEKERLLVLWWIKTGEVTQHQQLSQRLGRDSSTVTRWLQKYRQGGLEKLLEVKTAPGATPKITTEMRSRLEEKLKCPEGFGSYQQIVEWLKQEWNVEIKYKTVYRLVRYQLQAKLKIPRPQGKQQDEQAVNLFKKTFPTPLSPCKTC
ncbi:MAG: helix-turn-helix domain-containing protein [Nostoc sp. DedSLP03]|uniref:helix-turn-helix domain-containing protein n=1 Tax=Nostoc sp. DedSLP03 TaxID=3075400 RepID=UPI002AD45C74|nr:helix-turn-helix domain-containing protein [Nostoc sp. DedSLP03]MDZ7970039.1 helix-turn-helix domain-containing protein [Nostoc sp. DedSLP03]